MPPTPHPPASAPPPQSQTAATIKDQKKALSILILPLVKLYNRAYILSTACFLTTTAANAVIEANVRKVFEEKRIPYDDSVCQFKSVSFLPSYLALILTWFLQLRNEISQFQCSMRGIVLSAFLGLYGIYPPCGEALGRDYIARWVRNLNDETESYLHIHDGTRENTVYLYFICFASFYSLASPDVLFRVDGRQKPHLPDGFPLERFGRIHNGYFSVGNGPRKSNSIRELPAASCYGMLSGWVFGHECQLSGC